MLSFAKDGWTAAPAVPGPLGRGSVVTLAPFGRPVRCPPNRRLAPQWLDHPSPSTSEGLAPSYSPSLRLESIDDQWKTTHWRFNKNLITPLPERGRAALRIHRHWKFTGRVGLYLPTTPTTGGRYPPNGKIPAYTGTRNEQLSSSSNEKSQRLSIAFFHSLTNLRL